MHRDQATTALQLFDQVLRGGYKTLPYTFQAFPAIKTESGTAAGPADKARGEVPGT
jgi:hypothetical protein